MQRRFSDYYSYYAFLTCANFAKTTHINDAVTVIQVRVSRIVTRTISIDINTHTRARIHEYTYINVYLIVFRYADVVGSLGPGTRRVEFRASQNDCADLQKNRFELDGYITDKITFKFNLICDYTIIHVC